MGLNEGNSVLALLSGAKLNLLKKMEMAAENKVREMLGVMGTHVTMDDTIEEIQAKCRIYNVQVRHISHVCKDGTRDPDKLDGWYLYQDGKWVCAVLHPYVHKGRIKVKIRVRED